MTWHSVTDEDWFKYRHWKEFSDGNIERVPCTYSPSGEREKSDVMNEHDTAMYELGRHDERRRVMELIGEVREHLRVNESEKSLDDLVKLIANNPLGGYEEIVTRRPKSRQYSVSELLEIVENESSGLSAYGVDSDYHVGVNTTLKRIRELANEKSL